MANKYNRMLFNFNYQDDRLSDMGKLGLDNGIEKNVILVGTTIN